jgi:hypothetical protein
MCYEPPEDALEEAIADLHEENAYLDDIANGD